MQHTRLESLVEKYNNSTINEFTSKLKNLQCIESDNTILQLANEITIRGLAGPEFRQDVEDSLSKHENPITHAEIISLLYANCHQDNLNYKLLSEALLELTDSPHRSAFSNDLWLSTFREAGLSHLIPGEEDAESLPECLPNQLELKEFERLAVAGAEMLQRKSCQYIETETGPFPEGVPSYFTRKYPPRVLNVSLNQAWESVERSFQNSFEELGPKLSNFWRLYNEEEKTRKNKEQSQLVVALERCRANCLDLSQRLNNKESLLEQALVRQGKLVQDLQAFKTQLQEKERLLAAPNSKDTETETERRETETHKPRANTLDRLDTEPPGVDRYLKRIEELENELQVPVSQRFQSNAANLNAATDSGSREEDTVLDDDIDSLQRRMDALLCGDGVVVQSSMALDRGNYFSSLQAELNSSIANIDDYDDEDEAALLDLEFSQCRRDSVMSDLEGKILEGVRKAEEEILGVHANSLAVVEEQDRILDLERQNEFLEQKIEEIEKRNRNLTVAKQNGANKNPNDDFENFENESLPDQWKMLRRWIGFLIVMCLKAAACTSVHVACTEKLYYTIISPLIAGWKVLVRASQF
eukprot:Platyproteum_vivax@DN7145_c0_g1_i1.p1